MISDEAAATELLPVRPTRVASSLDNNKVVVLDELLEPLPYRLVLSPRVDLGRVASEGEADPRCDASARGAATRWAAAAVVYAHV